MTGHSIQEPGCTGASLRSHLEQLPPQKPTATFLSGAGALATVVGVILLFGMPGRTLGALPAIPCMMGSIFWVEAVRVARSWAGRIAASVLAASSLGLVWWAFVRLAGAK
jgi:hypothetical protein